MYLRTRIPRYDEVTKGRVEYRQQFVEGFVVES